MASEENRLEVRGDPMSSNQHGDPRLWPRPLRRLPESSNGPDHWRKVVKLLQQHAASDGEVSPAALAGVGCPVLLPAGDHDVDRPAEVARVVGDFMAKADDGVRPAPTAGPQQTNRRSRQQANRRQH